MIFLNIGRMIYGLVFSAFPLSFPGLWSGMSKPLLRSFGKLPVYIEMFNMSAISFRNISGAFLKCSPVKLCLRPTAAIHVFGFLAQFCCFSSS